MQKELHLLLFSADFLVWWDFYCWRSPESYLFCSCKHAKVIECEKYQKSKTFLSLASTCDTDTLCFFRNLGLSCIFVTYFWSTSYLMLMAWWFLNKLSPFYTLAFGEFDWLKMVGCSCESIVHSCFVGLKVKIIYFLLGSLFDIGFGSWTYYPWQNFPV